MIAKGSLRKYGERYLWLDQHLLFTAGEPTTLSFNLRATSKALGR